MKFSWNKNINGMQKFKIIWLGQFVSIMGTSMTKFALMIWAYQQVGKASTLALMGFFSILPYVLLSPLAGSLVDRYDRKKIMIFADLGAGIVTALIFFFHMSSSLEIWHLYCAEALVGAFEAFQIPAYISSTTLLIPKEKYSQASGMRSFSSSFSKVFAPVFAGFLLTQIGIQGVMMIDIVTFCVAMGTLIIVQIPGLDRKQDGEEGENSVWEDVKFGVLYLFEKRGLLLLLLVFVVVNFLAALTYFGILPAMILARSGGNQMALATVQGMLGIGGLVSSLIISAWGVPDKKVLTILIATGLSFTLGDLLFAVGATPLTWGVAAFFASFCIPYIMGAENALWQSKVDPSVQGRVFSTKSMLQLVAMPAGYITGGFLADYVFEPSMANKGILSQMFGWIVGTETGAGMAVMFIFTGVLGLIICIVGFLVKDIRNLEINIPDHDFKLQ